MFLFIFSLIFVSIYKDWFFKYWISLGKFMQYFINLYFLFLLFLFYALPLAVDSFSFCSFSQS
ncbi:hypothetical protein PRUPE_8G234300 [Prunus persica]|uniref:Uncharacterized protein n=1 Tax=Prunus persica TaxID=3760 RepID=A0A251N5E6_PRUPE|nr:hypothetical protein PRUPE_8G234300 [Prunus persica]